MAGPIRVLHVEDNDFFATVTAQELEDRDAELVVTRAERAEHALERLDDERFDCVLSDYEMPGMDGLAFLDAVRERYPQLPFVLLTGGGSEEVASEAISRGVTDYFRKRAGVEQFDSLANRIENAVARRQAERAVEKQVDLNDLVWDLGQRVLDASSREGIERLVCDGLAGSALYRYAWIGEFDGADETVVPRLIPDGPVSQEALVPDSAGDAATEAIRRAIRSGDVIVTAERDPTSDAHLRRAVVPLVYEGAVYGTVSVYTDRRSAFEGAERQTLGKFGDSVAHAIDSVKTRHALGRREQRLQVLNRVLRHNLRNDMTVILGYAENLLDEVPPEASDDARTIKERAIEVTEVSAKASEVTETLDRAEDTRKPVELTDLVERKITELAERFPAAEITAEMPEEAWVDADYTIAAAVEEVVENAVVHNDNDSPSVHVAVSPVASDRRDRLRIVVEDDGPRIPATERTVLVEGQETALQHSSGLGLWLVNWIVDRFGGDVSFADNEPRGNVVTVELGAARPLQARRTQEPARDAS